jgi:signal transduction histidine kinase
MAWRRSAELRVLLFSVWLATLAAAGTWFNPIWVWMGDPRFNPLFPILSTWLAMDVPGAILSAVMYSGVILVAYSFPDGRFVPRWTRWCAVFLLAVVNLFSFFPGSPVDIRTWPLLLPELITLGGIVTVIYAFLYRYRRVTSAPQRQQLKWFVVGLSMLILNYAVDFVVFNVYPAITDEYPISTARRAVIWELVQDTHWYASSFLFAIAIGLAVFRYRLWDVDFVINRALVYGTLTLSIIVVYVLVVGVLGTLAQSNLNWLASILATGLIAVLVQPLRDRLQSGVNRLMYGERDDPVSVLNRLGARLEATLAPEAVLPALVETVGQALKLPYVAIKLKDSLAAEYASGGTRPTVGLQAIPLKHQFETIGFLLIAPRAPGEPFSPLDEHLLENIARQAGMAVHAVSLTQALQSARHSLVTAREEERRRLRRDLHDGLGPALASQGLKLAAAKQLLQHNPASVEPLLNEVIAQTQETVSDVRRLVYGLRPPALDERGLAEAIRDHVTQSATSGLQVEVGELPQALASLPAAVEVAAYRIALEALTNVIRHAHAKNCSIQFQGNQRELQIEITDDGRGLPVELRAGVGLRSMRERAEELGGTLTVQAGPQGGTQVSARLPLSESTSVG